MADDKKKPAAAPAKKKPAEKATKAYKAGKNCPRCGAGVKLADHKDRRSCGKCGYFEKK
jgi:small subunit ribosomal protein S27Ae